MFLKRETSDLDFAVNRAIRHLNSHTVDSEEYAKTVDLIVKLHKMKMEE